MKNNLKSAVAVFFLFFLHGTSIGNGQQGISYNVPIICVRWGVTPPKIINRTKFKNMQEYSKKHITPTDANNVLAAGICRHTKHQIAEREFYVNQKKPFSGTRIICKKCGANKFIKDAKYGVYACR